MGEGVLDNVPTRSVFRLLLESFGVRRSSAHVLLVFFSCPVAAPLRQLWVFYSALYVCTGRGDARAGGDRKLEQLLTRASGRRTFTEKAEYWRRRRRSADADADAAGEAVASVVDERAPALELAALPARGATRERSVDAVGSDALSTRCRAFRLRSRAVHRANSPAIR